MNPRAYVCAGLLLTGCSAFSMGGPARFEEPSRRAAELLRASTIAPKFELDLPAEAITDARVIGAGFLLDVIAEEGEGFAAMRACGEVVVLDPATGTPRWRHARKGQCPNPIVAREHTLVTLEDRATKTTLTELDAESGAVVKSVEAGRVVALAQTVDLFALEEVGEVRSVVAYGEGLVRKWSVAVTAVTPIDLVLVGDTLYAYGDAVVAIDIKSGTAGKPVPLGVPPHSVTVVPHRNGLLVTRVAKDSPPHLTALGLDGAVRWSAPGKSALAADDEGALVGMGENVAFVALADGTERWKAKSGGATAGRPVFVDAPDHLVVVPQGDGLTAFVAATGAVQWTVPTRGTDPKVRHTDQLMVAAGMIVWDTWRHVVGVDAGGTVKYDLPVRSLFHPHREGRAILAGLAPHIGEAPDAFAPTMAAALNAPMTPGGATFSSMSLSSGLSAGTAQMSLASIDYMNAVGQANFNAMEVVLATRRRVSFQITQRYAAASAASPYVVRPIAWNLGRGFLLVRKSDGAFVEVVTGVSDVYAERFAEPSMSAFDPDERVLLTFTEGFATDTWKLVTRGPVEVAKQHVAGYAIDDAAWKPATAYATSSRVPDGSFLWDSDVVK